MSRDGRQAFAELLERHKGIVLKVAGSYAAGAEDRAELAQEIATQLWRAWPDYDPARPFSTWMYRVALNVAISHLRHDARRRERTVALDDAVPASADDGAGRHETDQDLRQLHRVIATLDPLNRALLLLYLEERSNREIGDILGLGESNVSTRLTRLRQRLRAQFA